MFQWLKRLIPKSKEDVRRNAIHDYIDDCYFAGRRLFIANLHKLQLGPNEYVTLDPPATNMGHITVTQCNGGAKLKYKYWPEDAEWSPDMPECEVIIELDRMQYRIVNQTLWAVIDDLRSEACLVPITKIFIASSFFPVMTIEMKRAKPSL